jgi:Ni/Fe-hydrogenase 1 B-type cytochrome subunit
MLRTETYPVESRNVTTYYVWDGFVRISHWINVLVVAVLIATGFYIGNPVLRPIGDDPSGHMLMGTVKNVHFLAAVIFTLNGLARAYWFVMGRTYRQWFRFNIWRADFWKEAWWKFKDYATLRYEDYEQYTLGHNALAALAYVLVFLVASVMGLTGFAMRGQINPGGFLDTIFGWVIPLLGGEGNVHFVHRLGMWLIIAFSIHHIAFVLYLEVLREKGMLSSMISGIKMRPAGWKPRQRPWEKR